MAFGRPWCYSYSSQSMGNHDRTVMLARLHQLLSCSTVSTWDGVASVVPVVRHSMLPSSDSCSV